MDNKVCSTTIIFFLYFLWQITTGIKDKHIRNLFLE